MNKKTMVLAAIALLNVASLDATATTTWSAQDYDLHPLQMTDPFSTRAGLLYVAKDPAMRSGTVSIYPGGLPAPIQSWDANHLGIPWWGNQYVILTADFNGDGNSDILMQRKSSGDSYLLLAAGAGTFPGISQTIASAAFGASLSFSADQHKLHAGDFNGDGKADLFFQATSPGGTHGIVYANSNGQFMGSATQTWTNASWGSFKWATTEANIVVGNFGGVTNPTTLKPMADLLVQAKPKTVLIDYDVPFPVPVYTPNSFGVVFSAGGVTPFGLVNVYQWNRMAYGVDWSPQNYNIVAANFDNAGIDDLLFQARSSGRTSYLVTSNSLASVFATGTALSANVDWSAANNRIVALNFTFYPNGSGPSAWGVYIQAQLPSGTNYTANPITGTPTLQPHDVVALTGIYPTTAVGTTSGAAGVSNTGAATYTIPLDLPSGINGMTPRFALVHRSDSGAGLLGMSWNFAGISSIARCDATVAQNVSAARYALQTTDRYCLDGNQLKQVSNGIGYGLDGSKYRTELETYSMITARGAVAGAGPQSFEVRDKAGLNYEYGGTADSRLLAVGGQVHGWQISRISDRAGNEIKFVYASDQTSGSMRPEKITYTGRTGAGVTPAITPAYEISFTYDQLIAPLIAYMTPGGGIAPSHVIRRITLKYNNVEMRSWRMSYLTNANDRPNRPLLTSVQQCGVSDSECLAPVTFAWTPGNSIGWQGVSAGINGFPTDPKLVRTLDFNGDGYDDVAFFDSGSSTYKVLWGSASGYGSVTDTLAGPVLAATAHKAVVMDVDGNGKSDLLIHSLDPTQGYANAWMALEHTSGTSFTQVSTGTLFDLGPTTNTTTAAADINGDGYLDIIYHNSTTIRAHLHGSSGAPTFGASALKWTAPAGRTIVSIRAGSLGTRRPVVDFDADTRQDLFVQLDTGYGSLFATDTGYVTPTTPIYQANAQIPGHFGWGKCTNALARQYPSDTWLTPQSMSNCGRSSISYMGAPITQTLTANIVVADYTGDGAQDVISYYPPWNSWSMSPPGEYDPNSGFGVQYQISLGFSGNSSSIFASDIDGDGLDDVTQIDTSGVLRYARHAGVKAELMTSANDGFGNSATFTYQSTSAGHCTTNDYAVPAIGLGLARYTRPFYVVCKLNQSNGIGGTFDLNYSYANPTTNVAGRGFADFESRSVTDSRTSPALYHLDEFSLDFPTTGMVKHSLDKQSSASTKKIREATITLSTLSQGSGASATYFPYVSNTSVDTYEVAPGVAAVDGVLMTNQTTAVTTIDAYGNVTDETYTTTDKDSTSPLQNQFARVRTVRTITNDATNWCLGIPTQVQTTSTLFDSTSRIQTQGATVDYANCRVMQRVNEPFVPALKVTTDFAYATAACGNVSSITVTGMNSAGTSSLLTRQTIFDYASTCRLPEQVTDPLGNSTYRTYRYDLGLLETQTDPNMLVARREYDSFGRVTLDKRPDNTSTLYSYSSCNQANGFCGVAGARLQVTSTERDATPATLRTDYAFLDGIGRARSVKRQIFDGALSAVEATYDAFGRVATQSVPYTTTFNGKTVYGYDLIGRQNSAQLFNGAGTIVRSASATFAGRTVTDTNPRGKTTTRRFDVLGQLRQVTDPAVTLPSSSGSTTYGYTYLSGTAGMPGEVGGVLQFSVTDALSNVTKARTNLNGFRTQTIDPDRGTWKYEYDSLGELTKRTDAASNILTFAAYDRLGRPVSRTEPEGTTNLTWGQVSDNSGSEKYFGALKKLEYTLTGQGSANYSETYRYDEKGRHKQTKIDAATDGSYDVDSTYDATTGLLDTITYPQSNGTTRLHVKYQYQSGILTSVRNAAVGGTVFWQVNSGGMDPSGNLTDEQLGNGVRVKSAYDPTTGLLSTRKSGTDGPATNRQNLEYLWDANGNLTRRTDNRQLVGSASLYEQFNYDEIDRLSSTSSNASGYTALTLTVDKIGNILTKSDFSASTYTYPASGGSSVRPHAVTSVGSVNYGYDANGNMNSRAGNPITWTTYGVPSAISGSGGLSSQFAYTPNRDRWKQTATYPGASSTVTETTLYIGGMMERVTRSDSLVTTYRHYIPAGSNTAVFVNFSDATTAQTYYVTSDHLGSASMVTNSNSATIVLDESFSAFGARRDSDWVGPVNSTDNAAIKNSTRRGYTGHEHLDNLGLIHMNGRIQDPALGRFISADPFIPKPADSQSLNRYSYVRNGPLSATDPTGFQQSPDGPVAPCSGFGCDIYYLAPPSGAPAAGIEGRANGAVAGLRPDVQSGLQVGGSGVGAQGSMTEAGMYLQFGSQRDLALADAVAGLGEGDLIMLLLYGYYERQGHNFLSLGGDTVAIKVWRADRFYAGDDLVASRGRQGAFAWALYQFAVAAATAGEGGVVVSRAMQGAGRMAAGGLGPAGSGARQLTANSCGMACGQRLLASEGIAVFQSNLTRGFYRGLTPERLAANLNRFSPGFRGFYAYPTAAQLRGLASNGPFIARLGGNPGHFVTVESVSGGTVRFFDPAGGVVRTQALDDFVNSVSGLVFK
jgi:RHS repeat-associated protein